MHWSEHTRYFLHDALVVNDQWGRVGVGGGFSVDLTCTVVGARVYCAQHTAYRHS